MTGLVAQEAASAFADKLGSIIHSFLQQRWACSEIVLLPTAAGQFVVFVLLLARYLDAVDFWYRRHGD